MSTEPMTQGHSDHDQVELSVPDQDSARSDAGDAAASEAHSAAPDHGGAAGGVDGGADGSVAAGADGSVAAGADGMADRGVERGAEAAAEDLAASTDESTTGSTDESTTASTDESTARDGGGGQRGARREHLEHEGEVAADFLETLLDIADLDGDLEVNVEGDRAAVAIVDSEDGPAPKSLVGRDGAVLDALQELTRLAVQADTGDRSRLMLDVAGHRAGRRAQLVELARSTSQRVKESGEQAELEPMSAFERKVVHDEVLAAGLVSESEGTEPNRYVVILPSS